MGITVPDEQGNQSQISAVIIIKFNGYFQKKIIVKRENACRVLQ